MKKLLALLLLLSSTLTAAAKIEPEAENPGEFRVVPMSPTPESDVVRVILQFPKEEEMEDSNPVRIEMHVNGFPLGTESDFPRKSEIWNDPDGQSVHIVIDNEPYFAVHEFVIDALDNNEVYYKQALDFKIPFKLKPGPHVIRVFPCRSFNESLKGDNCFESRVFYFQKKGALKNIDLSAPYLTYNEPQDEYDYPAHQPIMLDFYITNCQLSRDGYKVELYIDGEKERTITSWIPYYIYGLTRGSHKIRLVLIDSQNKPVPGIFNDVERVIRLK